MPLPLWVTKAFAGSGVAQKSEYRQLEQQHQAANEKRNAVDQVTFERLNQIAPSQRPTDANTNATLSPLMASEFPPPIHSSLSRSQPETKNYPQYNKHFRSLPADISGNLLSEERLKRNYSYDDVWDTKANPMLPPLPLMKGFGRYRMAVNADPEFQLKHLQRTLADVRGPLLDALGELELAEVDPEIWKKYRAMSERSPNRQTYCDYVDPQTGTRVTKGFAPEACSFAANSFRDRADQYRKNSTLSTTSSANDTDNKGSYQSSRQSSLMSTEGIPNEALTTIRENPGTKNRTHPKIERPCHFDNNGNTDSAIASEDEDDNIWFDEVGPGNSIVKRSNLTNQISRNLGQQAVRQPYSHNRVKSGDKIKPHLGTRVTVDRSKSIRASKRPILRRSQSSKSGSKNRNIQMDEIRKEQRLGTDAGILDTKPGVDPGCLQHEGLQDTDLILPNPKSETYGEGSEHPGDLPPFMGDIERKRSNRCAVRKDRDNEDDGASINSDSTSKTIIPIASKLVSLLPLRQRRDRSDNTSRVAVSNTELATKETRGIRNNHES